jgi:hypothetical protein
MLYCKNSSKHKKRYVYTETYTFTNVTTKSSGRTFVRPQKSVFMCLYISQTKLLP